MGDGQMAFKTEEMNALFQLGRAMGRDPGAWVSEPFAEETVSAWYLERIQRMAE